MFRPQIQKSRVLVIIATITMSTIFWVANSIEYIPTDDIKEKIEATKTMSEYIESLKNITNNNISKHDIYKSGLIGLDSSSTTSLFDQPENSFLNSKIACTHPNFSALIVHLFNEAELKKGDTIAVSVTGSLPGANIALLAACGSFDLTPIIISSVASSAWGANKENLTWLDIESNLYDNKLIKYDYKSKASSIGGEGDIGENLTDAGIETIEDNIISNDIRKFINEKSHQGNIGKKIDVYSSYAPIQNYSAFINIGGNSSSIGSGVGKDTMKVGVIFPIEIMDMVEEHYGFEGSIAHKFLANDVVFINIKNIKELSKSWDLYPPDISIEKNEGSLFYSQEPYTITTIFISLMINILIISIVGIHSHKQIKRRMKNEEYDSIL